MKLSLIIAVVLTGLVVTTQAQDCDSDGLPDIAQLGPFTPEPGGGLRFLASPNPAIIDPLDYSLSGQSFTIEMWVYRDAATGLQEFLLTAGQFGISNASILIGFRADNRFVFGFWNNDLETIDSFPPDGQWHHWMCRYDATNNFRWIFRDGVEVAFDVAPADFTGTMNTMFLGGLNSGFPLNGIIDELRIFDHVRADVDVLNDLNIQYTQTTIPAGLHAYYPFDSVNQLNDLAGDNNAFIAPGPTSVIDYGPDCNANGVVDQCDIDDMTSADCNNNGIPDECDIASGFSDDCNSNGIPDECETDCNANGIPDECDITNGSSLDCNSNGIPDECDISSGFSQDCNSNGMPDECDIANSTSMDCNGNGLPDECDLIAGTSVDTNSNSILDECEHILNLTQSTNWETLQLAIDSADPNDVIELQTGSYAEVQPVTIEKSLVIQSTDPDNESIVSSTRIDNQIICLGSIQVRLFGLEVQSLALTGSTASGQALFVADQCHFVNEISPFQEGIYIDGGSRNVYLSRSLISNYGTGIAYLAFSGSTGPNLVVTQSVIAGNQRAIFAGDEGSGADIRMRLNNSLFIDNNSGIELTGFFSGEVRVENSILRDPDALNSNMLHPNILPEVLHSNLLGGFAGTNVIDSDPLFVDQDGPDNDPATVDDNNYRLSAASPSVNTGLNNLIAMDTLDLDSDAILNEPVPFDIDGNNRVIDGTIDMGPYEFQGPPPCPADFTGEGDLNFLDVSAFLTAFGNQDPAADFTGEGQFNFLDVSAFLSAFGAGCP